MVFRSLCRRDAISADIEGLPEGPLPSWRTVYHDLNDLLERDWQNVREGLYPTPLPSDTGPIASARKSFAFFRDLSAVNRRREASDGQEVFNPDLRGRYPRYFLQNFHYQSGGYLTDESAALYDHQVEVLFVGGADAIDDNALGRSRRSCRRPPFVKRITSLSPAGPDGFWRC